MQFNTSNTTSYYEINDLENRCKVYPSSGNISIKFALKIKGEIRIAIYNMNGQKAKQIDETSFQQSRNKISINLTSLENGTYNIEVTDNEHSYFNKIVIKKIILLVAFNG